MALIFADRTMESSTTTGTGPIALGGALTGMQAFSASMSIGDTIYYAANGVDSNGNTTANWEVGLGTYSAASTLTRSVILASSNAGAAVSWPTGTIHIWANECASQFSTVGNGNFNGQTSTALATPVNATFTAGSGTLAAGTYYYRVTALSATGETAPSVETSLALTATGGVNVNWGAVTGATGYKVYGRSTGAELLIATVGVGITTYLDSGSITPAGAMPTSDTSGDVLVKNNAGTAVTTISSSGRILMHGAVDDGVTPLQIGSTTSGTFGGLHIKTNNSNGSHPVASLIVEDASSYGAKIGIYDNQGFETFITGVNNTVYFSNGVAGGYISLAYNGDAKFAGTITTDQTFEYGSTSGFTSPAVLTVGASPYTYTNPGPYKQVVVITGGTLSATTFVRNGVSVTMPSLDTTVTLLPGDGVTVTYTAAPTITTIDM